MLRGWLKLPYAIVNRETGRTGFSLKHEFEALSLCDGRSDTESSFVSDESRKIIAKCVEMGIAESCQEGQELEEWQRYKFYPSRYIEAAQWSITGNCNYRCKHCYMSAPDAKYGELSREECLYIVDQLGECGVQTVHLTGGEPLVRSDFMEIVDALLSRDIKIATIYTNGKLVTSKLLDQLESRNIRPEFNMSFDGVGWHDWIRGVPGAEESVISAFKLCRDRGFSTGAELVLHQKNKHTLRESINLLGELGVEALKTNPVASIGAWLIHGGEDALSLEETYRIYLDYIPYFFKDGAPLSLMLGGFFYAAKGAREYSIPAMKFGCGSDSEPKRAERMCICGHARKTMYIAPDGRTLPCLPISGMDNVYVRYPIVMENGLAPCITDSAYMEIIDTRLGQYLAHNAECAACDCKYVCGGGCRASALSFGDDILGPDRAICLMFKNRWPLKIANLIRSEFGEAIGRPDLSFYSEPMQVEQAV
jgi:radical SAM protein with 4Fe4S-binding SPASM domain